MDGQTSVAAAWAASERKRLWDGYMDGRFGPRNVVEWTSAEPGEVWIDLAGIACECVDGPDDRPCSAWIDGNGEPPPRWAWHTLLGTIAVVALARAAEHRAVVLDARDLIAALLLRPPGEHSDSLGPGELLRRLRNEHEDMPRDTRPGLLIALPPRDTFPRDDEARSGLLAGRAVWASGR